MFRKATHASVPTVTPESVPMTDPILMVAVVPVRVYVPSSLM